jgi:hypothetical protein
MKPNRRLAFILLALAGVGVLIPVVKRTVDGESLGFIPALAVALSLFLGAVLNLVLSYKSG